ncbi:chitooligosaccharidolytic beta-N-acetylglucosaminidase-like [Lycorma delicatula]|uniref:chitooligosaccharidolytic beta-N-acetylglucosaminidase-like n=1 Tax=Lycorma delicatula TaxID=130591 RepID=UPI003F510F67
MKYKIQFFIISLNLLFFIFLDVILCENNEKIEFSWECKKNKCIKEIVANQTSVEITSFNVCKLFCDTSILWPMPVNYLIDGSPVHISSISLRNSDLQEHSMSLKLKKMVRGAEKVFRERIEKEKSQTSKDIVEGTHNLHIILEITNLITDNLSLNTNEGYTLIVNEENDNTMLAVIRGETFFGVRNGLETLAQLIVYDNVRNGLVIPSYSKIEDYPQYSYRGILLDTSRNYFSVDSIKRTIDVMAANKLNSFHWHITDSHSFPLMLNNFRQFAEHGAYSSEKIYTEKDVKSIIDYASIRGVRIIPELDAPAHIGEGWQWTPEDTVLCLNKEPWESYCFEPPCGQLNPLSEHVYNILGALYKEFIRLFKPDIFHMGGDEVHQNCWSTSEDIKNWIDSNFPVNNTTTIDKLKNDLNNPVQKEKNINQKGFIELWNYFQERALKKLKEASEYFDHNAQAVIWTSDLTSKKNLNLLNKDYIIQVWTTRYDNIISELLQKDFRIILSNYDALYFNSGYGGWTTDFTDSIYRAWHRVYENFQDFPECLPPQRKELVLGQEAAVWSEMVSEGSLDSKLWPRAAALAERTWTNPKTYWRSAESRLLYHRDRLVRLGVKADAIEPEWCNANRGGCS